MKKKILIITAIAIAIIGGVLVVQKSFNQKENVSDNNSNEKNTENDIYHLEYAASYSFDMKNLEKMYDNHEFIAIIHVDSIDSATTYREKTNEYIKPYTPGKATILKALKGDFKSNEITFLRLGGLVSFAEYEKSLYPEAREKLNELFKGDKNTTLVDDKSRGDISIENDKTYLVYMNREDAFHNKNEYTIEAFEYGLREIKNNDSTKLNVNSKDILVKNNKTNEYETIEKAVSKKISKQFTSSTEK